MHLRIFLFVGAVLFNTISTFAIYPKFFKFGRTMTDAVILDARSQLRFTLSFARAKCIKRGWANVHFAVSSAKFDIYKTTKCYYSKHFY